MSREQSHDAARREQSPYAAMPRTPTRAQDGFATTGRCGGAATTTGSDGGGSAAESPYTPRALPSAPSPAAYYSPYTLMKRGAEGSTEGSPSPVGGGRGRAGQSPRRLPVPPPPSLAFGKPEDTAIEIGPPPPPLLLSSGGDRRLLASELQPNSRTSYCDLDGDGSESSLIDTRHFGPAPSTKQPRRRKAITKKQVQLTKGHLILNCPIPSKLSSFLSKRDINEVTTMRYTAATCLPDSFATQGYNLRPSLLGRETEILIGITMYNEDEILFTRTMHGVMKNIQHLCSRNKSRTWGKDGWKKVVVCIVADGRRKVSPRVLDVLAAIGVYQDGVAKNLVNGKEVTAHIYEYTTQVSVDSDLRFQGAEKGIVPVQIIFCLKEQNAKKLNSHRWIFNGFGPILKPNICVLIDVGTRPGTTSIYHLWKAFDVNSNVGGACGEVKVKKGKAWRGLLNPLVAAQNFEYKMSNILDKPLESVFGYITVLPGAFSAYRYIALRSEDNSKGPLTSYFKGEKLRGKDADVFTANMYLAEDRILCWELVAKENERWVLKYVRQATGETDVPDAVAELVSQRRRWLNGAFFAAVYAQTHFRQIWSTDHSTQRKFALHVEFIYQFITLLFSFFSLANFYLTFYFVCGSLGTPSLDPFGSGWADRIFTILRYSCVLLITSQFILAMGNRPQGSRVLFTASIVGFAIIMFYTMFAVIYLTVRSLSDSVQSNNLLEADAKNFTKIIIALVATVGLYTISSIIYLDPWHILTSFFQYTLLIPTWLCTMQIYAFCNTHDVSWGTKGDNKVHLELGAAITTDGKDDMVEIEVPSDQLDIDQGYDEALANLRERKRPNDGTKVKAESLQEDYYREIRTRLVLVWLVANCILAMSVSEVFDVKSGQNGYLAFLLWAIAALAGFRMLGSISFLVVDAVQRVLSRYRTQSAKLQSQKA